MKFLGGVIKGKLGFNFKTLLTYLLDEHPGAVFAMSHYKLNSSYTGYSYRIEREDGVNVLVGYDASGVSSYDAPITEVTAGTTNATIVGEFLASSGYSDPDSKGSGQTARLTKPFDSSGNGNDGNFLSTSSLRPYFAINGVIEMDTNGRYGLRFSRNEIIIPHSSDFNFGTNPVTVIYNIAPKSFDANGFHTVFGKPASGNQYYRYIGAYWSPSAEALNNELDNNTFRKKVIQKSDNPNSNTFLIQSNRAGSTANVYTNGNLISTTSNFSSNLNTNESIYIGADRGTGGSNGYIGVLTDLIIFTGEDYTNTIMNLD